MDLRDSARRVDQLLCRRARNQIRRERFCRHVTSAGRARYKIHRRFKRCGRSVSGRVCLEQRVVTARDDGAAVVAEIALELVEDAVIFVQVRQPRAQVLVHGDHHHGRALHIYIPQPQRHVIPRENIPSVWRKLDVRDRRNDFREKRLPRAQVLRLFKFSCPAFAQRRLPQVHQLHYAARRRVDKQIAVLRVELGRRDHLRQVLHVIRLDVQNVEPDAARVQVPQVHAQVVRRQKHLVVRVHRDAVDVVRVRVGKRSSRRRRHHRPGRFQLRNHQSLRAVPHQFTRHRPRAAVDSHASTVCAVQLIAGKRRERFDLAFRNPPQFDCLIIRRNQSMRPAHLSHPSNLVDLLLDFHRLEVVKLRLVRLELRPEPKLRRIRSPYRALAARRLVRFVLFILRGAQQRLLTPARLLRRAFGLVDPA
mmetsp:Transcript_14903/g.31969  ORF Transcript_14903/g.31969 Transcript_14903/m.31969 type:complete len:421 (-) Transcript_14903:318-1580(-)